MAGTQPIMWDRETGKEISRLRETKERNTEQILFFNCSYRLVYILGFVHFTGIWKCLGNSKADIVRVVDSNPELGVTKIRGGFLKIQGTWMPFEHAKTLCRRTAWRIRDKLIPLFGPTFADECLPPTHDDYGCLLLDPKTAAPHRSGVHQRRNNSTSTTTAVGNGSGGKSMVSRRYHHHHHQYHVAPYRRRSSSSSVESVPPTTQVPRRLSTRRTRDSSSSSSSMSVARLLNNDSTPSPTTDDAPSSPANTTPSPSFRRKTPPPPSFRFPFSPFVRHSTSNTMNPPPADDVVLLPRVSPSSEVPRPPSSSGLPLLHATLPGWSSTSSDDQVDTVRASLLLQRLSVDAGERPFFSPSASLPLAARVVVNSSEFTVSWEGQ